MTPQDTRHRSVFNRHYDRGVKPLRIAIPILLVAMAGCGGGSEKVETVTASNPATASTPSTATTPAPDAPSPAQDKQTAHDALIVLSDFPSGWTASDSDKDNNKSPCQGIQDAKDATNGRESSPDFAKGNDTNVSNTVYLYSDEAKAKAAFASLTSQDTRKCTGKTARTGIQDSFKGSGVKDAKAKEESTSELNIPPVGSESAASRITVPFTAILENELNMDLVFVRVGRGITLVTFVNIGSPFDDDQRDKLVGTTARRLDKALKQ